MSQVTSARTVFPCRPVYIRGVDVGVDARGSIDVYIDTPDHSWLADDPLFSKRAAFLLNYSICGGYGSGYLLTAFGFYKISYAWRGVGDLTQYWKEEPHSIFSYTLRGRMESLSYHDLALLELPKQLPYELQFVPRAVPRIYKDFNATGSQYNQYLQYRILQNAVVKTRGNFKGMCSYLKLSKSKLILELKNFPHLIAKIPSLT